MRSIGLHGVRRCEWCWLTCKTTKAIDFALDIQPAHTRRLALCDDDATIRAVIIIGKSDANYCLLYDAGMAYDDLEAFYRLTRRKALTL
jgi:hypothetical protein